MPLPVDRVDVGEHDVAVRQLGDDQLDVVKLPDKLDRPLIVSNAGGLAA